MSFSIQFYNNSSEPNRVDKTNFLTLTNTLTGTLRDECSLTDVSVTIQLSNIPTFNYAYIPSFNRYYYVTDITSVRNDLWEISMSVDVLMTYKNGILNCSGFIDRNENINNRNIIDNKRVVEQGYNIGQISIPNNLFKQYFSYVLTGFALGTRSGG